MKVPWGLRKPGKAAEKAISALGTRVRGEYDDIESLYVEHQLSFPFTEVSSATVFRGTQTAVVVGTISYFLNGPFSTYRLPQSFVQWIRSNGSIHTVACVTLDEARGKALTGMSQGHYQTDGLSRYDSYPTLLADIQAGWLEQAHAEASTPVLPEV
jgi:hypothetical protein